MTSEQQSIQTGKDVQTAESQHRGTQERRSGGRYQLKTCSEGSAEAEEDIREAQYSGCISAHPGALVVSCPERHGPAAVWRSILRDLPQGDRAGRVRRQGSIVTVDLEALTCERRSIMSADTTVAGMSMHPPSGGRKAPRVYLRNN